jgi:molybdopterin molybdotransferase
MSRRANDLYDLAREVAEPARGARAEPGDPEDPGPEDEPEADEVTDRRSGTTGPESEPEPGSESAEPPEVPWMRSPEPGPLDWADARSAARRAGDGGSAPARTAGLDEAFGLVLAEPLAALADLPAFDTSAMDGWAVSGPGPWRLLDRGPAQGLAGSGRPQPLADGTAVRIATGAELPPGATAVLRSEHGSVRADGRGSPVLHDRPAPAAPVELGRDIRPRGQECRRGDRLLPAGARITPAVLGLAAAAGHDALPAYPRPTVELLVLGDELLDSGPPGDGRVRDALSPMLPHWLRGCGAETLPGVRRIRDDFGLLRDALRLSPARVVVTTGGTAAGPVDFVHSALEEAGGRLLVDGVRVRPGHPMLLAELPPAEGGAVRGARWLVGLPGNPLAAVAGLVTLLQPLLAGLAGEGAAAGALRGTAGSALPGHVRDTRLLPVVLDGGAVRPLSFDGPAMLRGLAAAEGLAVVPPGGVASGQPVEVLRLPGARDA